VLDLSDLPSDFAELEVEEGAGLEVEVEGVEEGAGFEAAEEGGEEEPEAVGPESEALPALLPVELYRSLYQPPPTSAKELRLISRWTFLPHFSQVFSGSSVIF